MRLHHEGRLPVHREPEHISISILEQPTHPWCPFESKEEETGSSTTHVERVGALHTSKHLLLPLCIHSPVLSLHKRAAVSLSVALPFFLLSWWSSP
jgi:hypothetical protein